MKSTDIFPKASLGKVSCSQNATFVNSGQWIFICLLLFSVISALWNRKMKIKSSGTSLGLLCLCIFALWSFPMGWKREWDRILMRLWILRHISTQVHCKCQCNLNNRIFSCNSFLSRELDFPPKLILYRWKDWKHRRRVLSSLPSGMAMWTNTSVGLLF